MIHLSGQDQRPIQSKGRMEDVFKAIEKLYPDVDLKERSEDPFATEARSVLICTLRMARRIDEGKIQDLVNCGKTEIVAAKDRYSRERTSKTRFTANMRLLLQRFDPKSADVTSAQTAKPTLEQVTSAVWKEFQVHLPAMQLPDSKTRREVRLARDILAILLSRLTSMTVQEIESHMKRDDGYLQEAKKRMRLAAYPGVEHWTAKKLRTRLTGVCEPLGVTVADMFNKR
jgi:hypothetical protein